MPIARCRNENCRASLSVLAKEPTDEEQDETVLVEVGGVEEERRPEEHHEEDLQHLLRLDLELQPEPVEVQTGQAGGDCDDGATADARGPAVQEVDEAEEVGRQRPSARALGSRQRSRTCRRHAPRTDGRRPLAPRSVPSLRRRRRRRPRRRGRTIAARGAAGIPRSRSAVCGGPSDPLFAWMTTTTIPGRSRARTKPNMDHTAVALLRSASASATVDSEPWLAAAADTGGGRSEST